MEECEGFINEGPLYPIKSLFWVNFKDHIPNSALHLKEVSYEFLNNDVIIRGPPIKKEVGLARPYDVGQERFESIHNYFGDQLIAGIAETNGSKIFYGINISSFWDQAKKSFVHLRVHCSGLKHFFAEGNDFMGF